MSPIQDLSEVIRMPRLGKIRLGVKVPGEGLKSPYPKASDHFVCPQPIQDIFGEKPTELGIMFPVDDEEMIAQQWLRRYSLTQGLVCIGDGATCRRKVDIETAALASHITKEWEWQEDVTCDYENCPEYTSKLCRRVMNLQFMIPSVPGLGVWQIDTSSFHSIVNINSMIRLLKGLFGRCSMLPLTLALGPQEVSPPGQKKKTVFIMHIRQDDIVIGQLARMALLPHGRVLIQSADTDEPPDDLFPTNVLIAGDEQAPTIIPQETKPRTSRKRNPKKNQQEPPVDKSKLSPEDADRQDLYENIQSFLKRSGAPKIENLQRWFNEHYPMQITMDDFEKKLCPGIFSKNLLSHLHDSLLVYFEG